MDMTGATLCPGHASSVAAVPMLSTALPGAAFAGWAGSNAAHLLSGHYNTNPFPLPETFSSFYEAAAVRPHAAAPQPVGRRADCVSKRPHTVAAHSVCAGFLLTKISRRGPSRPNPLRSIGTRAAETMGAWPPRQRPCPWTTRHHGHPRPPAPPLCRHAPPARDPARSRPASCPQHLQLDCRHPLLGDLHRLQAAAAHPRHAEARRLPRPTAGPAPSASPPPW